MNDRSTEFNRMTFVDLREREIAKLGTEDWITLYRFDQDDKVDGITYFCALVDPDYLHEALRNASSWDLTIGRGGPGFNGGDESYRYARVGDRPIEPFVYRRDFMGPWESYNELSEEFRLFHNLYEDKRTGRYVQIDETLTEVPVARVTADHVEVKLRYLKEYLSARDMYLLLFFEYNRFSVMSLDELGVPTGGIREEERYDDHSHRYFVDAWDGTSYHREAKSFARLIGKKVIYGSAVPSGQHPLHRERKYAEFIIGTDINDGSDILCTCDDDKLSDFFGKNPGKPNYLTPVFFTKDVLAKYYNDARRFTVKDSHVSASGAWSVRIDNNQTDHVIVFLGDLGQFPYKEQLYWKSFNVVPEGKISRTYHDRSILGNWVEPEAPDLLFKARYENFREMWTEKFGWDLFKPLRAADAHTFDTLHVPSDGNHAEFGAQVMALTKVLIERINDKELTKRVELDNGVRAIAKLEKYLTSVGFLTDGRRLDLLHALWMLRNRSAHAGDTKSQKSDYFQVDEKGYAAAFADILRQAIQLIKEMTDYFGLGDDQPDEEIRTILDAMK
jgi:hypothetical protein